MDRWIAHHELMMQSEFPVAEFSLYLGWSFHSWRKRSCAGKKCGLSEYPINIVVSCDDPEIELPTIEDRLLRSSSSEHGVRIRYLLSRKGFERLEYWPVGDETNRHDQAALVAGTSQATRKLRSEGTIMLSV